MNRFRTAGQSATPVLVFFGIISLSVVFFFLFTLPRGGRKQPAAPQKPAPAAPSTAAIPSTAPGELGKVKPLDSSQPAAGAAEQRLFFVKAAQLLDFLTEKLAGGKPQDTLLLMDPAVAPEKVTAYQRLFDAAALRPAPANSWKEIGRISGTERWELALERGAAIELTPSPALVPATPAEPLRLWVDLKLTREEGYKIVDVRFPGALLTAVQPALAAKGVFLAKDELVVRPDPLAVSQEFLSTLLARNFGAARGMTDQAKVAREKLAGLCIVFEEGGFALAPQSALNVTAVNADRAWSIIRVQSAQEKTHSEFALEMSCDPARGWKVDAIDLNKLLDTHIRATSADARVAYRPIVTSPAGGESLAVYFDYNEAKLTPRAARQLEIVAGILKSEPARKLQISGFADSLGSENYNFKLSQLRADTVRAKLNELGVNPAQIVSQGFGESKPLAPNQKDDGSDDPDGRSVNRRTEIYLDF